MLHLAVGVFCGQVALTKQGPVLASELFYSDKDAQARLIDVVASALSWSGRRPSEQKPSCQALKKRAGHVGASIRLHLEGSTEEINVKQLQGQPGSAPWEPIRAVLAGSCPSPSQRIFADSVWSRIGNCVLLQFRTTVAGG
jgi:hypothetical protein